MSVLICLFNFNVPVFISIFSHSKRTKLMSTMMLAKFDRKVQLIYLSDNKLLARKGLFCFLDVIVVVAVAAVVAVVVVVDCNESKQKWLEVVLDKKIVGERRKDNEGGQILMKTSNEIVATTKIKWKLYRTWFQLENLENCFYTVVIFNDSLCYWSLGTCQL